MHDPEIVFACSARLSESAGRGTIQPLKHLLFTGHWCRWDRILDRNSAGVYGLNPKNGEIQWTVETKSGITGGSPLLSSAGTLFTSDLSGRLYAIKTSSHGLKAQVPWLKLGQDN